MRFIYVAIVFLTLIGLVAFAIHRLNESTTERLVQDETLQLRAFAETLVGEVRGRIDAVRVRLSTLAEDADVRTVLTPGVRREELFAALARTDAQLSGKLPLSGGEVGGVGPAARKSSVLGAMVVDVEGRIVERVRPDGGGALDGASDGGWSIAGSDELKAVLRAGPREMIMVGPRPAGALLPAPAFPDALANRVRPRGAALRFGRLVFGRDGERTGAVMIDVDLDYVTGPLAARAGAAGRDARRIFVVDKAGCAILHPDPTRRLGVADDPAASILRPDELPAAVRDAVASGRGATVDAGDVISATEPIASAGPGSGWSVVATVPRHQLTAAVLEQQRQTYLLGALILLVVIVALLFTGRLLFRDIASRTKADHYQQLAQQETENKRHLSALIDAIEDAIIVHDRDYRVSMANRVAKDRYGHDLVDRRCFEFYRGSAERTPACERDCPVDRVFATGKPYTTELRDPKSGEVNLVSCYPRLGSHGEVLEVIEHCRDITERKRLEEQLVHNEKLSTIGEMAAGVAHEINNPIGAISMFAQLLAEEIEDAEHVDEDTLEKVRTIEKNAEQVGRIARNLLDFSRKSSGEMAAVHLGAVVERALGVVTHQSAFENVRVRTAVPADLPTVLGDEGQLTQVVANLAMNAAHAMEGGGELHISARRCDLLSSAERGDAFSVGDIDLDRCGNGVVRLDVRDTGHGMPRSVQRKIFDPFFTTKAQGKGTGLGLAVTFGIITQHGGRIEVESEEGKGTRFTIELPALLES